MIGIRGHFDGSVVVPDEPLEASPQTPVVVLFESANAESKANLEAATREYYEGQTSPDPDDDAWGEAVVRDLRNAWDEE